MRRISWQWGVFMALALLFVAAGAFSGQDASAQRQQGQGAQGPPPAVSDSGKVVAPPAAPVHAPGIGLTNPAPGVNFPLTDTYDITGSITLTDPTQTGRLTRDGVASNCATPKPCPGTFDTTPGRNYDAYTFTNTSASTECVTVVMNVGSCLGSGANAIFSAAYLGTYSPANLCNNYLADSGGSPNVPDYPYSFNVPAGATFQVVVHEVTPGSGCPLYNLSVSAASLGSGAATPTPTATGTPPTATPTACSVSSTPLTEDFETGLGSFASAVATCAPGGCGWAAVNTDKHGGAQSAFAPDLANVSDQSLELSSGISIPANATSAVLSFWHRVSLEAGYDGGVLEFSTDNGATWSTSDPTFLTGPYNATISSNFSSPIAGRHAWSGTIGGVGNFVNVQVNLMSYAGQANLRFRFREANDSSATVTGWWVDDVSVTVGVPCVNTPTATATATSAPTNTTTPTATATPVNCPLPFTDVDQFNPFYQYIQCLYCRGIISGYADNTFRWTADVTRGQVAKIIANAAGLTGAVSGQTFTDVGPGNPFYVFIERLVATGAISGYNTAANCPTGVPCFRWELPVTRGQLAKIDANAAGYNEAPPATPTFKDVPAANPFYVFIERLSLHNVISGYTCGGPGEPCPGVYYRPNNNITRGQVSKVASQTFFPNACAPAQR